MSISSFTTGVVMISSCVPLFFNSTVMQSDLLLPTVNPEIHGRTWRILTWSLEKISYIFCEIINKLSSLLRRTTPIIAKGIIQIQPSVQSGISNNSNSCYLNSVVQALSAVSLNTLYDEIETLPKPQQERVKIVREHLKKLHDKLLSRQPVSSFEINTFRNVLRTTGFQAGATTQEDAEQLCSYLLDILHVKPITYLIETLHEAPVPIPHLDARVIQQSPMLPLKYEKAAKDSSIQQLLYSAAYSEELDPETLKETLPAEYLEKLKSLGSRPKPFPALRSIYLKPGNIPTLLPIHLSRFTYIHGYLRKKSDMIMPNEEISVPIAGSTSSATYELSAIVIHKGVVVDAGHYYCYIPKIIAEKKVWIHLDDGAVTTKDPADCLKDAAENGYLYFYTLKK